MGIHFQRNAAETWSPVNANTAKDAVKEAQRQHAEGAGFVTLTREENGRPKIVQIRNNPRITMLVKKLQQEGGTFEELTKEIERRLKDRFVSPIIAGDRPTPAFGYFQYLIGQFAEQRRDYELNGRENLNAVQSAYSQIYNFLIAHGFSEQEVGKALPFLAHHKTAGFELSARIAQEVTTYESGKKIPSAENPSQQISLPALRAKNLAALQDILGDLPLSIIGKTGGNPDKYVMAPSGGPGLLARMYYGGREVADKVRNDKEVCEARGEYHAHKVGREAALKKLASLEGQLSPHSAIGKKLTGEERQRLTAQKERLQDALSEGILSNGHIEFLRDEFYRARGEAKAYYKDAHPSSPQRTQFKKPEHSNNMAEVIESIPKNIGAIGAVSTHRVQKAKYVATEVQTARANLQNALAVGEQLKVYQQSARAIKGKLRTNSAEYKTLQAAMDQIKGAAAQQSQNIKTARQAKLEAIRNAGKAFSGLHRQWSQWFRGEYRDHPWSGKLTERGTEALNGILTSCGLATHEDSKQNWTATDLHHFMESGGETPNGKEISTEQINQLERVFKEHLSAEPGIKKLLAKREISPQEALAVAQLCTSREAIPEQFKNLRISELELIKTQVRLALDSLPREEFSSHYQPFRVSMNGLIIQKKAESGQEPDWNQLAGYIKLLPNGFLGSTAQELALAAKRGIALSLSELQANDKKNELNEALNFAVESGYCTQGEADTLRKNSGLEAPENPAS